MFSRIIKPTPKDLHNATAIKLRKLIARCALCHATLSKHRFAQLGTTVVGNKFKPRMMEFLGHAKRHEWERLAGFKDWKSDQDNLIAYVISGSHPGGLVIVTRDPFELYASDELLLEEVLTANELTAVSKYVSDWREL